MKAVMPEAHVHIAEGGAVSSTVRGIWSKKIAKVSGVTLSAVSTDPAITHVVWSKCTAPDDWAARRSIVIVNKSWMVCALEKKRRPTAAEEAKTLYAPPASPPTVAAGPPLAKRRRGDSGANSGHSCTELCESLPGHRDRKYAMQFRVPMRTPASPNASIIAALVQQIELTSIVAAERNKKRAYGNTSAYLRCLAVLRAWPAPLFVDDNPAKGVDEAQLALFEAAQFVGVSAVRRIRELAGRDGAIVKVQRVLENDLQGDHFQMGCHLELRAQLAAVHGLGHSTVLKMVQRWPPAIGLTRFAAAPGPVHFLAACVARDGALRAAAQSGVALLPAPALDADVAALLAVEKGPLSLVSVETKKGLQFHTSFQQGISPDEVAYILAEVAAVLKVRPAPLLFTVTFHANHAHNLTRSP